MRSHTLKRKSFPGGWFPLIHPHMAATPTSLKVAHSFDLLPVQAWSCQGKTPITSRRGAIGRWNSKPNSAAPRLSVWSAFYYSFSQKTTFDLQSLTSGIHFMIGPAYLYMVKQSCPALKFAARENSSCLCTMQDALTKELKSLFGPFHKQPDVLILCETAQLIKPARVDKPVEGHVGFYALPAAKCTLACCLQCNQEKSSTRHVFCLCNWLVGLQRSICSIGNMTTHEAMGEESWYFALNGSNRSLCVSKKTKSFCWVCMTTMTFICSRLRIEEGDFIYLSSSSKISLYRLTAASLSWPLCGYSRLHSIDILKLLQPATQIPLFETF